MISRSGARQLIVTVLSAAYVLLAAGADMGSAASGASQQDLLAGLSDQEIHRLGERMYREGLQSDGTPLRATIRGDVEIDSTMFSCTHCHSRGGLGSVEGQVSSPSINGSTLYNPGYFYKDVLKNAISEKKGGTRHVEPVRPAYTDETLATALREGINPKGRTFLPIMPRYYLGDRDTAILVRYLKNLSSAYSPGVTETTLHFATIVTDDVPPADRDAMLLPLQNLVKLNNQYREKQDLPAYQKMSRMLGNTLYRNIDIAVWELKGPPASWRAQMEEYYRKAPVFAILGGLSGQPWQPVHDFCEANQIPDLFPITDLPVVSDKDWYTLYLSKGYYQEGEAAARFIIGSENRKPDRPTVQIVRPAPQGKALAAGFNSAWNEAGAAGLITIVADPQQTIDKSYLSDIINKHHPGTIVIWAGQEVVAAVNGAAAETQGPDMYFVSSRYLDKSLPEISSNVRHKVFITYPYRLPETEKYYDHYSSSLLMGDLKIKDEKRIASRTYSLVHIFIQGLQEMKLNFYRDTLIDVIGMRPDQTLPDFERFSFGPGQRYASKGCYIVQLDASSQPKLIRKSNWVIF